MTWIRVARWYIFKPKIQIWVNFRGPMIGKCFYILWPFGIFYRHLEYFMTIWYTKYAFVTFFSRFGIMYEEKSGNPDLDTFPRKKFFPLEIF
jgi:hypothetical protein